MTKQFHDHTLGADALDQIFREARSYNGWHDKPVGEDQIRQIYELLKMGPTSANSQPGRFVWCVSQESRDKLAEFASEGNVEKIKSAPAVVVIGYDIDFHEELPWLFPHTDAKSWFEGDEEGRIAGAKRNSALQGAYLIVAARAIGLDCGAMSGIDLDKSYGPLLRRQSAPPRRLGLRHRIWRQGKHFRSQPAARLRQIQPHRLT